MALDPGTARIGVAVSDPLRIVASPVAVLPAEGFEARLRELCDEYRPVLVVVGLPVGLAGTEGPSAARAREFAARVADVVGVEVEVFDERFTTATAEAAMLEGGVRRRDRRRKLDKVAAAVILRNYLDRLDRLDSQG